MPVGAAIGISAVAGVGSALISSHAASSAADKQVSAENHAADLMQQQYQQTRSDLLPYNTIGQGAASDLSTMEPFSFAPTEANLEATPGYKFALNQGLKSTQNSAAARGLGSSGAALKGAATFATGLADNTYQNRFKNALDSYTTNVGVKQNLADLGENAAAQTGNFGTTTAGNIGQTAVGAANASAAGTVGSANAITNGLTSASNAYLTNQFLKSGGGGAGMYSGTGPAYSYNTPAGSGGAIDDVLGSIPS